MNKFCENCGQPIEKDAKFCTKCGHSVNDFNRFQSLKRKKLSFNLTTKSNYIVIGALVIILVLGFGCYRYKNSPAHNPNNPLSNQTITFHKDSDGKIQLSEKSENKIVSNAIYLAMKKDYPNSEITKYIEQYPQSINSYVAHPDSGQLAKLENKLLHKKHDQSFGDIWEYYAYVCEANRFYISNPYAQEGDQVTVKIPFNAKAASWGQKKQNVLKDFNYGPRTVKVKIVNY